MNWKLEVSINELSVIIAENIKNWDGRMRIFFPPNGSFPPTGQGQNTSLYELLKNVQKISIVQRV